MPPAVEAGAAIFEVERFEWAAPDRLELTGVWTGLRARRFIRPTLVLETDAGRRRLLAVLEHKPWSADDGADWIAAFAWTGEPAEVESAQLNVASGIDIELPPPRRATGKRPARRFRHRAVSRDASRQDAAEPAASRVVAPAAETEPPKPAAVATPPKAEPPKPEPPKAEAPKAEAPAKPPKAEPPKAEPTAKPPKAATAPKTEPTAKPPKAEPPKAEPREVSAAPEPAEAAAAGPEPPEAAAGPEPAVDEPGHRVDPRTVKAVVERARVAELRAGQLVTERDEAVARRKAIAAELSSLKQSQEQALGRVRAQEREIATTMLSEGADLRARIEKDRDTAYSARDAALGERDEAHRARDEAFQARERAVQDRKQALAERKSALRERDKAFSERDKAVRARDEAIAAQEMALDERDEANREREKAYSERDGVISAQQRGLPVLPAQPRHLPSEPERSPQEVWVPRAIAAGALALFLLVVLKLIAGL
ncbi:MAG: binding protein-like family [Solirubrobacteraceae bacterium]|nr:binding protein-like family [Solirubrobacteraceae bacterium]